VWAPAGLGVGWIAQVLPFQCSASVTRAPAAPEEPIAVQFVEVVHDTPDKLLFWAPAGLGGGWIVQAVPFHVSANAVSTPLAL
jgi:hypothetical protein